MQRLTRYGSTLVLGTALALAGACGKGDNATTDSAGGSVSDSAATAMAPATPTDSAAMAAPGATAAMTAPNALSMIALDNGAEVDAGKLAQDKATNADVKAFAKMLVEDHSAMQKEADALATKNNLTPQAPAQADQKRAEVQQASQKLASTPKGAEFDRTYVQQMVDDHQKTLTELQQMENSVDNADLKALIQKAIPKVQAHLDRAQQLQSSLK